jgi:hypothetical protein
MLCVYEMVTIYILRRFLGPMDISILESRTMTQEGIYFRQCYRQHGDKAAVARSRGRWYEVSLVEQELGCHKVDSP